VTGNLRSSAAALLWVVLAALIAFGGAGLVAAMDHTPGSPSRVELTWSGDGAVAPALDAATGRLQVLSDETDRMATFARQALALVVAGDLQKLNETIAQGTLQLDRVEQASDALGASLDAVPDTGPDGALLVSDELRGRYDELAKTRNLTQGLRADWAAFTGRALDAAQLTGLLARHDQETAAAAKQGAAGHYAQALKLLAKPDATLKDASALRDRLASTTDVSTLTRWIDLNAAYDKALRTLYTAITKSKGRVTSAVRKAFDGEAAARANLPGDTRGLVVIMAEIAQGGLNQAVISIEQARGSITQAIQTQQELAQPSPAPS
jgi:hypothetical protein